MVRLQCINVGLNTLFKVAANASMSRHLFLVYAYVVAALLLLLPPSSPAITNATFLKFLDFAQAFSALRRRASELRFDRRSLLYIVMI
ncbi:hypothetical protein OROMI_009783 [Orobanche minor]